MTDRRCFGKITGICPIFLKFQYSKLFYSLDFMPAPIYREFFCIKTASEPGRQKNVVNFDNPITVIKVYL